MGEAELVVEVDASAVETSSDAQVRGEQDVGEIVFAGWLNVMKGW